MYFTLLNTFELDKLYIICITNLIKSSCRKMIIISLLILYLSFLVLFNYECFFTLNIKSMNLSQNF